MNKRLHSLLQIGVVSLVLVVPALACSEAHRLPNPTTLAQNDLSNPDFSGKNIYGYDLSNRNLQGINLKGSIIGDMNFSHSDLRNANLSQTSIQRSDFTGSDLQGAKMDTACLEDSIWTDAKLDPKWQKFVQLISMGIEPGQDLRDYDLSFVCLREDDLSGVNLSGVDLKGTYLFGIDLSRADLRNTDMSQMTIRGSNLSGKPDLTGATLNGTLFDTVNLKGAIITQEQLNRTA